MAKRFIDTDMFDDPWFMDLSKDGKLLWIYFITKCNHAGIIEINRKLISFQAGIMDIETVIKELASRLVTVSEDLYFIPKFITFQYPGFPQSKVRQQVSAVAILNKYKVFDVKTNSSLTLSELLANSSLTLSELLPKSYDNDNGNGNGNKEEKGGVGGKEGIMLVEEFYKSQVEQSNFDPEYSKFVDFLFGRSDNNGIRCENVLRLKRQMSFNEFKQAMVKYRNGVCTRKLSDFVMDMENKKDLTKKYSSFYLTLISWIRMDQKQAMK